jgi:hypothetical protein
MDALDEIPTVNPNHLELGSRRENLPDGRDFSANGMCPDQLGLAFAASPETGTAFGAFLLLKTAACKHSHGYPL